MKLTIFIFLSNYTYFYWPNFFDVSLEKPKSIGVLQHIFFISHLKKNIKYDPLTNPQQSTLNKQQSSEILLFVPPLNPEQVFSGPL